MAPDDVQRARERGIRDALERAGAGGALDEALAWASLSALPAGAADLRRFLDTLLLDALSGRVHPKTARDLVDTLIARWAVPDTGASNDAAITIPPPPTEGEEHAYADLATGAVHTRPTPVWELLQAMGPAKHQPPVWMIVSNDASLGEMARRAAPPGTEVLWISSMAVLKGAIARTDGPSSCIVLDAVAPSIPLDRAVAALVEDALGTRVVLWRMAPDARKRLCAAVPHARAWLAFDDEVTAREIVQLLRV